MNTKTDEISSGLVAVAWLAPSNYEWPSHFISMTEIRNGEPLVRLSDAEAIINDLQTLVIAENQRKQQLEEDRDTWKARAEFSYAQRDNQSAALKLARSALDNSAPPYHLAWITKRDMALAAIDALGE